jgi:hypothetical protein
MLAVNSIRVIGSPVSRLIGTTFRARLCTTSSTFSESSPDIDRSSTLNVSTIGHQGHGKSTLTDALLAVSGKRFNFDPQPPLNRNATNASLCEYFGNENRIMHTDCPGTYTDDHN